MMGNECLLLGSRLGGADIHAAIDLHGIRGDHFSVYRAGKSRGDLTLSDRGRSRDHDQRLSHMGHAIGLVTDAQLQKVQEKYEAAAREISRLEHTGVAESDALNALMAEKNSTRVSGSARLGDLLRRPGVEYDDLAPFDSDRPHLPKAVTEQVQIQMKYAGYLARQEKQVAEFKKEESRLLPPDADYTQIAGLRLEARQKLSEIRPMSIGQAGRISGVSPADIAVLLIWLEQNK